MLVLQFKTAYVAGRLQSFTGVCQCASCEDANVWRDRHDMPLGFVTTGGLAMVQRSRPALHLRLSSRHEQSGEISLTELAKIAQQTQRAVSGLAQSLIDDLSPENLRHQVAIATRLYLVGMRSGSTVLDIAAPEQVEDALAIEGMPVELRDLAMMAFVDALQALSQEQPKLPIGVDHRGIGYIDGWLRSLRRHDQVSVDAEVGSAIAHATVRPAAARRNLRAAETQPSLPYVSASHQTLTGRLYALNLRTGTFSIEDDARHSIRLVVPADMRDEAAQLANKRVRAIGIPSVDNTKRRLISFEVVALDELPPLGDQLAFFETHPIVEPPRAISQADLTHGVVLDLSDDEIDAFASVLKSE